MERENKKKKGIKIFANISVLANSNIKQVTVAEANAVITNKIKVT